MTEQVDTSQARLLRADDLVHLHPVQAVWEITLACDLKCIHCGSRAGAKRPTELSTQQCLDVVAQLDALGCREVNLIGGEAYLRKDWTQIIAAVVERGMHCAVQTGARNLTDKRIEASWEAGLRHVGVSIDGLADVHDEQRAMRGSWAAAMDALRRLHARGFKTTVNTQINRDTRPQLPGLLEELAAAGVQHWRLQLTVAMGRAADHAELLLEPFEMTEVMDEVAALIETAGRRGMTLRGGNNIGYFGPHHHALRGTSADVDTRSTTCGAGRWVLGLEADGTIKGCPSLPTTPYGGGNVLDVSIAEVWENTQALAFARERTREDLWGFCRTCYYGDACQAGCSWTSHVLFGRPGNNPYCDYRSRRLAEQGMRERVVPEAPAPGLPFDHGLFALKYETLDGSPLALGPDEVGDIYGSAWPAPGDLTTCANCLQYVHEAAEHCPFCAADIAVAAADYAHAVAEQAEASQQLVSSLQALVAHLQDGE